MLKPVLISNQFKLKIYDQSQNENLIEKMSVIKIFVILLLRMIYFWSAAAGKKTLAKAKLSDFWSMPIINTSKKPDSRKPCYGPLWVFLSSKCVKQFEGLFS